MLSISHFIADPRLHSHSLLKMNLIRLLSTSNWLLVAMTALVACCGWLTAAEPGKENATELLPWMCYDNIGCMPQLFLLGVQKGGSSTLFKWMYIEAGVCGANNVNGSKYKRVASVPGSRFPGMRFHGKETQFFNSRYRNLPGGEPKAALFMELYSAVDRCRASGFVEATPGNFDGLVAKRVRNLVQPSWRSLIRFVVSLREPISRELSAFNHQRSQAKNWRGFRCSVKKFTKFEDYATCILDDPKGLPHFFHDKYANHLRAWSASFYRSQILVFEMRAMLAAPAEYQSRLLRFARLPPIAAHALHEQQGAEASWPHANEMRFPGKQHGVSCDVVARLNEELFDEWNQDLYDLMRQGAQAGARPPEEPDFPVFRPFVCVNKTTRNIK